MKCQRPQLRSADTQPRKHERNNIAESLPVFLWWLVQGPVYLQENNMKIISYGNNALCYKGRKNPHTSNCFSTHDTSFQVFDCNDSHELGAWTISTCWTSLKLSGTCIGDSGKISLYCPGRIKELVLKVCFTTFFFPFGWNSFHK